jgi:cytoskeletal protein RodZ
MATVAEQLRAAREAKKLTVYQVAETTKIRTDHIRALEEGDFNVFAAPVYIRGFVRIYATLLKLDVPQIVAALEVELGRTEKFKEPPPLVEESHTPLDQLMFLLSKFDWHKWVIGLAVLGIVLLAAIAGFAWRHHRHAGSLAGLPPAVYQPVDSGETLPLPHR